MPSHTERKTFVPYFKTPIRAINRQMVDNVLEETPVQDMGKRIQVPGHPRTHHRDPLTGQRTFLQVNKTAEGPLKMIFKYGVCYIPDPETASDADLRAAGFGCKEAAQAVLDYAMDKENGCYGPQYGIDPNDADGYWKKKDWLEEAPVVKTYVQTEKAKKMNKAFSEQKAAGRVEAGTTGDVSEQVVAVAEVSKPKRGWPKGKPRVTHGAKGVGG